MGGTMRKSYEKPAVTKREKLAAVTALKKKPISYVFIKGGGLVFPD